MTNKKCQHKKYYKTSVNYKLTLVFSKLVGRMLKGQCNPKFAKYFMCSQKELKLHIEKQWLKGMNWKNYGYKNNNWNIHHIIPISFFNLQDEIERYMCCQYQNLQPLWQNDHIKKHQNKLA